MKIIRIKNTLHGNFKIGSSIFCHHLNIAKVYTFECINTLKFVFIPSSKVTAKVNSLIDLGNSSVVDTDLNPRSLLPEKQTQTRNKVKLHVPTALGKACRSVHVLPPTRSLASSTVTLCPPALTNFRAAPTPATPAPMIIISLAELIPIRTQKIVMIFMTESSNKSSLLL